MEEREDKKPVLCVEVMSTELKTATPKKVYLKSTPIKNKLCRLCGSQIQQKHCINIFSKAGRENALSRKLFEIFNLKLTEGDALSQTICRNCHKFVNKIASFKQTVYDVQTNLRQSITIKRGIVSSPISQPDQKKSPAGSSKKKLDFQHQSNVSKKDPTLQKLSDSCYRLAKRKTPSILYSKDFNHLKTFEMTKLWDEMKSNVPHMIDVICAVSGKPKVDEDHIPKYCLIYSILMNIRWHELSLFQRLNTVLMAEGACQKKLYAKFGHLGICQSHASKLTLLDKIGGHFMDKTIEMVKEKITLRGTADNWDLRIKVATRKDHQNQDFHLMATNLIGNRVDFIHLSNSEAIYPDIRFAPRSLFSLSPPEWKEFEDSTVLLISRLVLKRFSKFKFMKHAIPNQVYHPYQDQMAKKSTIVNMPIIDASEANYGDCVKVLRTYEKWIAEIYHTAGLLPEVPEMLAPEVDLTHAEAGQRYGHTVFSEDDPMKEMKIVMGGDQLTRVRFAGAKDLLKGTHTPSDRLEHCSPFKPVMWHCKASLLQYSYALLFSGKSVKEVGTLKYFREKLNRKNVTAEKVVNSYDGCEDLFMSVGRGYILVALMAFFGMDEMSDQPKNHPFPPNLARKSDKEVCSYLYDSVNLFLDKYLFHQGIEEGDTIQNYGLCMIFLTVLLDQLKDTAKEGDGKRNIINQKLLFTLFRSMSAYSKYAIEMFTSIAQIECLLTPRLSEEFKWGFFVNWRGGTGLNMEEDLAQEISNKIGKDMAKGMGPNKTIASISKVCKAVNGVKEICENYEKILDLHKVSTRHTSPTAENDEKEIVHDLLNLKPFQANQREHESFSDLKRSPLRYLDPVEHDIWIETHKKQLYVPKV